MFSQPQKSNEDLILSSLAKAYKNYESAEWNYAGGCAGAGRFLIDGCLKDTDTLKSMAIIIGKGLLDKKEDAKTASLLFDKLYKDGFKDGLGKDAIRARFKEILPEASIKRLNEDDATMADCMQSICLYEQTMQLGKAMGFGK